MERVRPMINSQTSRYKKVEYFIQENGTGWNVVEYPTNDVVRTFRTKIEADRVAKEISRIRPFGNNTIPDFLKDKVDTVE